jgi:hypothetical protein
MGVLEFQCMTKPVGLDENGEKIFFGVLDTADSNILAAFPEETTETLDAWIQSRVEFQKRIVGVTGIWLEHERLGKVIVGYKQDGAIEKMKALGQKMLRAMLSAAGRSFPVTATDDELALAAVELKADDFEPKPTARVAEVGSAPMEDEPRPKPDSQKRK